MVDYFTRGSLRRKIGPDFNLPTPPVAPIPLPLEVSGEQRYTPDQVNRDSDPTRFAPPTDIVGGSFFGPKGELVNPGSGYRFTDPVLKGPKYSGPFGEIRALSE